MPASDPDFKVVADTYFYVGAPSKVFVDARPAMVKINAVYTPLVYARPVVSARVEFAQPVFVAPSAAIIAPGVAVGAELHIPIPSVHIGIGVVAPGVIIDERVKIKHDNGRHRGHYK